MILENRYVEVQEVENTGEREWPDMSKQDERMQGSILVCGPVDFEKVNCYTNTGKKNFLRKVWTPSIFTHTSLCPSISISTSFTLL